MEAVEENTPKAGATKVGEKEQENETVVAPPQLSSEDEGDYDMELVEGTSTVFLKDTQTNNPHNDYSQHFVDTGQRPQNFIRESDPSERFDEYPKHKELIKLKDAYCADRATPPMYVKCDLREFDLKSLNHKFDVILIDAPLEEYYRRAPGMKVRGDERPWKFQELMNLRIQDIADSPCFVFFWVGSSEGLQFGRDCFRAWGFRRCEDICWIKTNKKDPANTKSILDTDSVLQHTKEHCLMGLKGTVRRSTDGHIIHANVDTDVIITEEPPYGSTEKPVELYSIIERFSLGRRRLCLFGKDTDIRPGWVTIGPEVSSTYYSAEQYAHFFAPPDSHLLGSTPEIEMLRPKSPPLNRREGQAGQQRGPPRGGPPQRFGFGYS
eukprot:Colp12_sorted_trinity150504_noHs@7500